MLHAGIRALNSLADLEVLQSFNEKYFGNTVENKNPTLLEVLHFEEEILRQKIMWKEKYESVISSWITPKSAKSDLRVYKIDEELDKTGENRTENKVIKPGEEKQSVGDVKTKETNQENITPPKTDAPESDKPVVDEVTKIQTPSVDTGEKLEPATAIATDENSTPVVTATAQESTPAAVEQMKPAAEEIQTATDNVKLATVEELKSAVHENIKPAAAEEKKTAAEEIKPEAEEENPAAKEIKPETEEINKPTVATAAEDEKLASQTPELAQPQVNPNEEVNDERKPEAHKKRKIKNNSKI